MQKVNFEKIQIKIKELCEKLPEKIDINSYVTFGKQEDLAKPNIQIDNLGIFNFIIVERGNEIEKRLTRNLDDLLYWIFDLITFDLASKFELQNRDNKVDFRRILFEKQEEIMAQLSNEWKIRKENAHNEILKIYPFTDNNK